MSSFPKYASIVRNTMAQPRHRRPYFQPPYGPPQGVAVGGLEGVIVLRGTQTWLPPPRRTEAPSDENCGATVPSQAGIPPFGTS